MKPVCLPVAAYLLLSIITSSCGEKKAAPSKELINEIGLKRGNIISCGNTSNEFGTVDFEISFTGKVKEDFNLAVKLLHSFEYDEAEKAFAEIIDDRPDCAMAYWGIAMSNFHPLWTSPSEAELKKGAKAIEIGQSISVKTEREEDYLNAVASFYNEWNKVDHRSRCINFEKAMGKLYAKYPNDNEAATIYALALNAAVDPTDKTFGRQRKAGNILNAIYNKTPNHPGVVHYIIHTYDSPELAEYGLKAARRYASVAPSSAHALHMPSHIFTRLGLWDECINSNVASVSSAKCYAEEAGMKGHWDEELHGLDYLVYSYLQKGENVLAKKQWDYLNSMNEVSPINFKVAYAFAAIPSRYLLENKLWKEAANLKIENEKFSWQSFPWQKAIIHFTRSLGLIHTGEMNAAKADIKELNDIHNKLLGEKDTYKANQVQIQIKASEAWLRFKEGKNDESIKLITKAANMEDKTEKHPVTPCEVIPARELLGDLLLAMGKNNEALIAYEADLKKHPNRFNGLYGAGVAAEKTGNKQKANSYYQQLFSIINVANSNRPEIPAIRKFLKQA